MRKPIKWTLSDDTLTVGGYLCKTATCQLHGRKWTVRYSEDIPTSAGPWKLCGLPGLILKAEADGDIHRFTLASLERIASPVAMVGLQKRYAPAVQLLKQRLHKERLISYDLHYLTGVYPEGNALLDLYIHPLDLVCFLFGQPEILACRQVTKDSFILMLQHSHIIGTLELSTAYAWTTAEESLKVCTYSGVYTLSQMEKLTFSPTSSTIFGIPMEKLRPRHETKELLFLRNNFTPILANNQVYTQGYHSEIAAFVEAIEDRHSDILTPLSSLKTIYETILRIQTVIGSSGNTHRKLSPLQSL